MPGIETSAQLENLKKGLAPGRGELLREISCGVDFLTDFLAAHYLERYIPEGGSKIKFVTGHKGSGKTHLACALGKEACVRQMRTKYIRLPDLLMEYEEAANTSIQKKMESAIMPSPSKGLQVGV